VRRAIWQSGAAALDGCPALGMGGGRRSAWLPSRVGWDARRTPFLLRSHARLSPDRPPARRLAVGRQWITRNGAVVSVTAYRICKPQPPIALTFVWSLAAQRTDLRPNAELLRGRAPRISDQDQDRTLLAPVVACGRPCSFRLLDVVPANLGGRMSTCNKADVDDFGRHLIARLRSVLDF
jgi:hypothetical protein